MRTIEQIARDTARFNSLQEDWQLVLKALSQLGALFSEENPYPATNAVLPLKCKERLKEAAQEFCKYKTPGQPDPYDSDKIYGLKIIYADIESIKVGVLM